MTPRMGDRINCSRWDKRASPKTIDGILNLRIPKAVEGLQPHRMKWPVLIAERLMHGAIDAATLFVIFHPLEETPVG